MSTMPPGSVVITPTDMYAEIRVMSGKVDHLASILDPALSTIRGDLSEAIAAHKTDIKDVRVVQLDHEHRLRSLDKRIWLAAVLAAGSGVGVAQIIATLGG